MASLVCVHLSSRSDFIYFYILMRIELITALREAKSRRCLVVSDVY